MAKVKNIIISDRVKTNMSGIRVQNPILSKESIDEGTINETIGLDSANKPVRKNMGDPVTETELPEKIEQGIETSLLNGSLKTVLQAKTFGIVDFPLTSDIDNQHATVNEGLLPNGDMSDLTETQINRIANTMKRIINKGWLKTSISAINLTSVMYGSDAISIVASSVVFKNNALSTGQSYRIFLDIANSSYEYSQDSYSAPQE